MATLEEIRSKRGYTSEQLESAKLIADEILHAKGFSLGSELSKVGTTGYKAGIGSPHQWWEEHCAAYRVANEKYKRDRDLHTVCLLAEIFLKER